MTEHIVDALKQVQQIMSLVAAEHAHQFVGMECELREAADAVGCLCAMADDVRSGDQYLHALGAVIRSMSDDAFEECVRRECGPGD